MNWENLKKGMCPKPDCESLLIDRGMIRCEDCDFAISKGKYFDLIKEKQKSKVYKKKVDRIISERSAIKKHGILN